MEGKGKSKRPLKLSMVIASLSVLLVTAAMAFTFLAVTPVIAQEATVMVTVNAPPKVEKGGTFVVTIDVDSVTDFSAGNFDLSFDSSVVKVSDVKNGEINGEEIPIYMWRFMDADTVRVAIMMEPVGEKCVSGSGYLAEIELDVEGKEGEESNLDISNEELRNVSGEEIPASWYGAEIRISVKEEEEEEEEEEKEEVGEEVTPGSPNITAWKPAEADISNAVGESRAFNISINQIADISWQINGTEVQTNESTREAVFTNKSAVIGTWNVSAITTNTTTGLSDMHTWIWSVAPTAITPTPTLTPEVTPTPTLAPGETPKPTPTPTLAPKVTPKPTTPTPTPKPAGFEAMFAIVGTLAVAYILLRKR